MGVRTNPLKKKVEKEVDTEIQKIFENDKKTKVVRLWDYKLWQKENKLKSAFELINDFFDFVLIFKKIEITEKNAEAVARELETRLLGLRVLKEYSLENKKGKDPKIKGFPEMERKLDYLIEITETFSGVCKEFSVSPNQLLRLQIERYKSNILENIEGSRRLGKGLLEMLKEARKDLTD